MEKLVNFTGLVAAMDRSNVDTDQIIPKQFLKRIERTGFGKFVFFDWRFDDQQQPREDFELNRTENQGTTILLTRRGFGTGSSREHAVWALQDFGFKCIIAESFGDIFYNNCFKNGVLPIVLDGKQIDQLFQMKSANPALELFIDLENRSISSESEFKATFEIDEFRRQNLLQGLDDIGLTLKMEDKISEYERIHGIAPTTNA